MNYTETQMKLFVVAVTLPLLVACVKGEDQMQSSNLDRFGTNQLELLRNISSTLDTSRQVKTSQHKEIMEKSQSQHQIYKEELENLHKKLKEERSKHLEEVKKIGQKKHQELKNILQQIIKHLDSSDDNTLGQIIMNLTREMNQSLTESKKENQLQSNELQSLYRGQSEELQVLKKKYADEIKKEREQETLAFKAQHLEEEKEIKILLQQVMAKIDEPRDCYDIYKLGIRNDGVYLIRPNITASNFFAYCELSDTSEGGGGWTVIQRRGDFGDKTFERDGPENFRRNWAEYKLGFGILKEEFWLGNEHIHLLTKNQKYELRINMRDVMNASSYASFENFALGSEAFYYRLSIGKTTSISGTRDTGFTGVNGQPFSTINRNRRCGWFAGWWFRADCKSSSNLNGCRNYNSMNGITFDGTNSLSYTVMKIRPIIA